MSDPGKRTTRRQSDADRAKGRQTLTRADVIRAGAHMLDREGADNLSMRGLAAYLGTGPSTLYWHVQDKERLLVLILDETLRPIKAPVHGGWEFRLEETLLRLYETLLPRPALIDVVWRSGGLLGSEVLRMADLLVGLVAESGLPEAEVVDAYLALLTLVFGYVMAQTSSPGNPSYRQMLRTSPVAKSNDYPNLQRYAPGDVHEASQFRYALERFIDAIKIRAHEAGSASPGLVAKDRVHQNPLSK